MSANANSWNIVPTSTLAGVVLAVLFLYLFFRHLLFVMMFMDLIIGWLRRFNWFPKEGKRLKTIIHWGIALALLVGFLSIAGPAGWLEFIPQ